MLALARKIVPGEDDADSVASVFAQAQQIAADAEALLVDAEWAAPEPVVAEVATVEAPTLSLFEWALEKEQEGAGAARQADAGGIADYGGVPRPGHVCGLSSCPKHDRLATRVRGAVRHTGVGRYCPGRYLHCDAACGRAPWPYADPPRSPPDWEWRFTSATSAPRSRSTTTASMSPSTVNSGCRAVAEDLLAAASELRSRHPDVVDVWSVRVGHRALRHFGGRPLRSAE